MASHTFAIRLRGIQGNDINMQGNNQREVQQHGYQEHFVAMSMIEILDEQGRPVPQSVAQLVLNGESLEKFGSKILKTGTLTISFD